MAQIINGSFKGMVKSSCSAYAVHHRAFMRAEQRFTRVLALLVSYMPLARSTAPSMLETSEEESSRLDDASSRFRDGGIVHDQETQRGITSSYTRPKLHTLQNLPA